MILYRTKYFGMLSGIGQHLDQATGKIVKDTNFNMNAFREKYRARMQKKLGINNLTDKELDELLARKRELAEKKLEERSTAIKLHNYHVEEGMERSQKEVNMMNRMANGEATSEDIKALQNKDSLQSRAIERKQYGQAYEYGGKYYKMDAKGNMVEITDEGALNALRRGNVHEGVGPVHTYTNNGMNIHYNTVYSNKNDFINGVDTVNTFGTKKSDYGSYHDTYGNIIGHRTGKDVEGSVLDDIKFDRAEDAKRAAKRTTNTTNTNNQNTTNTNNQNTSQQSSPPSSSNDQKSSNSGRNILIGAGALTAAGGIMYGAGALTYNNKYNKEHKE